MEASATDREKRLDQFLRERLPQYSRSRLQDWIEQGRVLVDGSRVKRSHLLKGAERIHVQPGELAPLKATPEDLPLEVLYEDADVIAVNKPAGMVVHTGAGRHSGTLVNAVLHRFGKLSSVGGDLRPGIVHRLDRFTSGVILVARQDAAHRHLAEQFAARQVEKIYVALVHGKVKSDQGRITTPIARDPVRRVRMTARAGVCISRRRAAAARRPRRRPRRRDSDPLRERRRSRAASSLRASSAWARGVSGDGDEGGGEVTGRQTRTRSQTALAQRLASMATWIPGKSWISA